MTRYGAWKLNTERCGMVYRAVCTKPPTQVTPASGTPYTQSITLSTDLIGATYRRGDLCIKNKLLLL